MESGNPDRKKRIRNVNLCALVLIILVSACGNNKPMTEIPTLRVMTHDSFEVRADLVASFEEANQVKLAFIKSGDTGSALNKAILAKEAPLADVFYGVDNTFLSRALEAGIFESYSSAMLKAIPAQYQLDGGNYLLPIDYADVCINFDKGWFSAHKIAVPGTFEDLLKPENKNLLVMENPATSSTGLAFLLATINYFGVENYLDFWEGLRNNGLVVVNDWNTAYFTNFSASSGRGPQPLVVSYASSPVAEVVFAETELAESPTGSMTTTGTCFRQVEFAGILKGTQERQLAEKFLDFLLSVPFQKDMPLQMFVYPVNPQAQLPAEFIQFSQTAIEPASLPAEQISANREIWISDWVNIVLH